MRLLRLCILPLLACSVFAQAKPAPIKITCQVVEHLPKRQTLIRILSPEGQPKPQDIVLLQLPAAHEILIKRAGYTFTANATAQGEISHNNTIYPVYKMIKPKAPRKPASTNTARMKAEIARLTAENRQITVLQKTITAQNTEIIRLKALCQEYGIDISRRKKHRKYIASVVNKPIFGIFLGESTDSLMRRFAISPGTLQFKDEDHPGEIWNVQNENPNVKQLSVHVFNARIYTIEVSFIDGSRTNHSAISEQLEKKYKSKDEGGITGALFGKDVFETVIGGMEIRIELDHDVSFTGDDKLELSYTLSSLSAEVYEEIQRCKARKIKDEL